MVVRQAVHRKLVELADSWVSLRFSAEVFAGRQYIEGQSGVGQYWYTVELVRT